MGTVVEFGIVKAPGEECNGMDFAIFKVDREDSSNSIVECVGLHNQLPVRDPMGEDRSMSKSLL